MAQSTQRPKPNDEALAFSWPCEKGYFWELLLNPKKGKPYECGICGLLARQPIELICTEHSTLQKDENKPLPKMEIYCQKCIDSYLKSHKNLCPSGNHALPKYQHIAIIDRAISSLKVKCPRSLQQRRLGNLGNKSPCKWTGRLIEIDVGTFPSFFSQSHALDPFLSLAPFFSPTLFYFFLLTRRLISSNVSFNHHPVNTMIS